MLLLIAGLSVYAQQADSIKTIQLSGVTVTGASYKKMTTQNAVLPVEVVEQDFLRRHFTGNLMQSLAHIPGVRSMDIGSGFSKPMIRGMAFNRILVSENGIRQEGQQWGSDHGLEIDAFNMERVTVRKGPMSLQYGSDAMGGTIEILQAPAPVENQLYGEAVLLGKTVNNTLGGSVMLGIKKGKRHTKFRYSEQQFGDYRIPADRIVYLTQQIPVSGRKLKNTAGYERNVSLFSEYRKGRYYTRYAVSNTHQKTGFFPGAHGIPDISRTADDGNDRNMELPYSKVNHLKVSVHQQYIRNQVTGIWHIGYQNNHREEWSQFHTHYGRQVPPEHQPDKELAFTLNTYSSSMKIKTSAPANRTYTAGWDIQYQQNRIGGYSFLLPEYNRLTTGIFGIADWRLTENLSLSGGIRLDYGQTAISAYNDPYLETYLQQMGYGEELLEKYQWRSYPVNRTFKDASGSLGIVWNPSDGRRIKAHIGKSFRLPGANELAANGVHHGTFRHEQGNPSLSSERGWQLDISYMYEKKGIALSLSPFIGWFTNYIYLKPTAEWSVLPHAGQIYRYTGSEAIFTGTEIAFDCDIFRNVGYRFAGEYIYTYNRDEHIPLSFSPPASMRNTLNVTFGKFRLHAELQSIASQKRISGNEQITPGVHLLHAGGDTDISVKGTVIQVTWSLQNLFDRKYYNHLSFYRKVEIPEPGRNFQLLIKIPFKSKLK
jgi:iron complex outermembrane receptor protein